MTGIDMPSAAIGELRARLEERTAALDRRTAHRRLRLPLGRGRARASTSAGTAAVPFLCAAMLPPSFVEYALRAGADGVLIAACREGDCEFRDRRRLVAERLAGSRAPALRPTVPRERVRIVHAGSTDLAALRAQLDSFRTDLASPRAASARHGLPPKRQEKRHG